jgi:hypothetical protein
MRGNRFLPVAAWAIAVLTATATPAFAGSSGTGGGASGIGAATGSGSILGHGPTLGLSGSGIMHDNSSRIPVLGDSGKPSDSLIGTRNPKESRSAEKGSSASHDFGLGDVGGNKIKPIDPDLDMTKLGRLGSNSLSERDIQKFDEELGIKAPPADAAQNLQRGSNNRHLAPARRKLQQEQQELEQELNTSSLSSGSSGAPSGTDLGAPLSSPPALKVFPPEDNSATAGPAPGTTATGMQTQTTGTLSSSDMATLSSLLFPNGSPVTTGTASAMDLDLAVGATVPSEITLIPLPDAGLSSAEPGSLGYFFSGTSAVIAKFDTRSVVAIVSNGS